MDKNSPGYYWVRNWILLGVVMIFFQIIIGGITRLTGSGLSITKWDIVTGVVPPLNAEDWNYEFNLYKETPQYKKINEGMSMRQFKFIYFWEYIHRLWARSMGFVFLIPFLIFWRAGYLRSMKLRRELIVVFFLAALVGLFGWIMVASGLNDRPWVSAYKLSIHLSLALVVLSYLFWVFLNHFRVRSFDRQVPRWLTILLVILSIQIVLGGMMSGLKAALVFPHWPNYSESFALPLILLEREVWQWQHVINYEDSALMPSLIQFLHRSLGYMVAGVVCYLVYRYNRGFRHTRFNILLLLVLLQVLLGVAVLLNSTGTIPVFYGVLHQTVAIFLLMSVLYNYYLGVTKQEVGW